MENIVVYFSGSAEIAPDKIKFEFSDFFLKDPQSAASYEKEIDGHQYMKLSEGDRTLYAIKSLSNVIDLADDVSFEDLAIEFE